MDNAATAKFIADARAIHGDAYDYRLVDYQGSKVKVTIICPIHGEFEKQPNKHLSSRQGCPTCGDLRGHGKRRQTLDVFIEKARGVHGDRYDYSKVIYQNNSTKVIIGCPDHGDFQQIPNSHLNGRGCPSALATSSSILPSSLPERKPSMAIPTITPRSDISQARPR